MIDTVDTSPFDDACGRFPDPLMHDAELDWAIASIWILPPGQVTETSFSPGLQMSSHWYCTRAGRVHAGLSCQQALLARADPAGPLGRRGMHIAQERRVPDFRNMNEQARAQR